MSKKLPELSRTEWLVMNLCWERGQSTARQIFDQASDKKEWEYQTVKTMLDRLVDKGYLTREKLGPLCLFTPAVPRARVVAKSIDSFWDTVLGNTFAPLFAHLAKNKKLSDQEIQALKKLIEEREEEAEQ